MFGVLARSVSLVLLHLDRADLEGDVFAVPSPEPLVPPFPELAELVAGTGLPRLRVGRVDVAVPEDIPANRHVEDHVELADSKARHVKGAKRGVANCECYF